MQVPTYELAKENLIEMSYNPKAVFVARNDGKIGTISKWNLLGRLYHYYKGDSSAEKVKKLVTDSLDVVKANITRESNFYNRRHTTLFSSLNVYANTPREFSEVTNKIKDIRLINGDHSLKIKAENLNMECQKIKPDL